LIHVLGNTSEYIHRLVQDLFKTHTIEQGIITPIIEVDEVKLNIKTAVPCGLIINELLSNSLKYAFPQERKEKFTYHSKQKKINSN
jgi:two-component sensor histidine kinase